MSDQAEDGSRLERIVLQRLESFQRAGVTILPRALAEEAPISTSDPESSETSLMGDKSTGRGKANKDAARLLSELQSQVAKCTLCGELAETRTQTVFGVGDPQTRLCFFGEAPGADEDRQGEPFVGRAGKLLTDMIQKGMGLQRSDVYILNVLKCRPPGNRNPTDGEVTNCRPFFSRQIDIIQPEFICCLGSVAAQNLLETKQTVGRLRGDFHDYRGIPVLVTYHPAYLLRNPSAKKETWKDLQILMRAMGLPINAETRGN